MFCVFVLGQFLSLFIIFDSRQENFSLFLFLTLARKISLELFNWLCHLTNLRCNIITELIKWKSSLTYKKNVENLLTFICCFLFHCSDTALLISSFSKRNSNYFCRGITRIHRLPSRPSHPYGRQPHSLIFISTLYKATCCLPASS